MTVGELVKKLQTFDESLPVVFGEFEPCLIDEAELTFYHPDIGDATYKETDFNGVVLEAASDDVEGMGWSCMTEEDAKWLHEQYEGQVRKYITEAKKVITLDTNYKSKWKF